MSTTTTTEAPNLFADYDDMLTVQEQEDLTALIFSIAGEDGAADVRPFDPAEHVTPNPLAAKPLAVLQPATIEPWLRGAFKVTAPYFTYGSYFERSSPCGLTP